MLISGVAISQQIELQIKNKKIQRKGDEVLCCKGRNVGQRIEHLELTDGTKKDGNFL